jgi:hypothetical protein
MVAPSQARVFHTQQVHYLRKDLTFADTAVLTVGVIPAGAIVVGAGVVVSTAWNSGTSDVLDIGTSGDGDGFATDLSLRTIGNIVWDELATSNDLYSTSDVTITCQAASTGAAATAGLGHVYVQYIPPKT